MIIELPVELIAHILSLLDLASLITVSYLSRRLHSIAADSSLNPWRDPILRNLQDGTYEPSLKTLCVRYIVPRQNWIEILSLARSDFLLFEATLPNLKGYEWEECFRRQFLPGWRKWKKEGSQWREAFMKWVPVSSPWRLSLNRVELYIECGIAVIHLVLAMKHGPSKSFFIVFAISNLHVLDMSCWIEMGLSMNWRPPHEISVPGRYLMKWSLSEVSGMTHFQSNWCFRHQNNLTHLETRVRVGLFSETVYNPV